MRIRQALSPKLAISALLVTLTLLVGCPHRSPLFSPDGRHLLVLAGREGEKIDRPATQLWLIRSDAGKYSPRRIAAPGGGGDTRFLAASWLGSSEFAAMTVSWNAEDEESVDGSERLWTLRVDTLEWSALNGPPPSVERAPRRPPVAISTTASAAPDALVYPTGDQAVVVVSREGKLLSRLEPAELVGPGPAGGFLVYRTNEETGENILVSYGRDLKARWRRGFADLSADIARKLGKKVSDVVFNDTNTSSLQPSGSLAVQLIFSGINWKDGVSGYCVVLDAESGALQAAVHAVCVPGVPSLLETKDRKRLAWAVSPSAKETATIRALPIPRSGEDATSLELSGLPMRSVHGYRLDPDGRRFALSVNGDVPRVLVYPVRAGAVTGKPVEVRLE